MTFAPTGIVVVDEIVLVLKVVVVVVGVLVVVDTVVVVGVVGVPLHPTRNKIKRESAICESFFMIPPNYFFLISIRSIKSLNSSRTISRK